MRMERMDGPGQADVRGHGRGAGGEGQGMEGVDSICVGAGQGE